ncbi:hypothetical protein D3C81_1626880 [compost metagenome]
MLFLVVQVLRVEDGVHHPQAGKVHHVGGDVPDLERIWDQGLQSQQIFLKGDVVHIQNSGEPLVAVSAGETDILHAHQVPTEEGHMVVVLVGKVLPVRR